MRIGLIQNSIVASTTSPVAQQRDEIFKRIEEIAEAAGRCNVNVLCLQELWRMLFIY
jgi:beta-ureidopropionase